jgi:putative spermidine/putrescine transport system permease protein
MSATMLDAPRGRADWRGGSLLMAMLAPILLVNVLTFLAPVINLATLSFRGSGPGGSIQEGFTTGTWTSLLADSFYWEILLGTVWTSLLITLLTLLCSYPVALFVSRLESRWRNLMMVVCISPLLVSAVVRTYGWMILLGDQGFVPGIIRALGMSPPRLLFNETGVIIGLTEILMPYMILSLLAGFGKLDRTLEDAAGTLGARPFTVFRRIVLPVSLPGLLLGCLLTFVLAVSSFITPKLLGGGRVVLLATEIYDQAIVTLNWPLASALSILVLVVFGAALALYGQLLKLVD